MSLLFEHFSIEIFKFVQIRTETHSKATNFQSASLYLVSRGNWAKRTVALVAKVVPKSHLATSLLEQQPPVGTGLSSKKEKKWRKKVKV